MGTPMPETGPFIPGECVDITIKGARVVNSYPRTIRHRDDTERALILVADYAEAGQATVAINVNAPTITVERTGPAEWPPQRGDLWSDRAHASWFAVLTDSGIRMISDNGARVTPESLLEDAPLTLLRRDEVPF